MYRYQQRGELLIENLLMISLLALFAVITLPHWQYYQHRQTLRQNAWAVLGFLTNMRMLANQQNRYYQITLLSARELCVIPEGITLPSRFCQQRPYYRWQIPLKGTVIQEIVPQGMGFYGRSSSARAGHLLLQQGEWYAYIILSAHGRLRFCLKTITIMETQAC